MHYRRAGSARRRILGADTETDPCHRGAGGPGSAQRRRYSGAAGQHRRYRKAEPDRGAGQRCSTESVSARRYCGAEVRVRRLGGWLPCRGSRTGLAGRHFGAGADTRLVPRRRTARRISRSSGAPEPRTCAQSPPIPAAAPHSRGCPAPHLATRRRTLLLSRSALRAALHLFPSAADRPPVASRRGRWPGAVQSRVVVLCSSQKAPRLRTGCSAGAPAVAPPPRWFDGGRLASDCGVLLLRESDRLYGVWRESGRCRSDLRYSRWQDSCTR